MFPPLKPNVTFGQEDPVYWQLHRFLHWEDARRAIPRRRRRNVEDDVDNEELIQKSRLVKAFAQPVTLDDRIQDPAPAERPRRIRSLYAKELNVPGWMEDDLIRGPSPPQGTVHPWDLEPTPATVVKAPEPSTGASKTAAPVAHAKTVKLLAPILEENYSSSHPSPRNKEETKEPRARSAGRSKPKALPNLDRRRPSSAVRPDDPQVKEILNRLKSRHNDPLPKVKKEEKTGPAPEPFVPPKDRIKAEFRAKRKQPERKKYVPMSKRGIKPPSDPENWDDVQSTLGGDFNKNAKWKPITHVQSPRTPETPRRRRRDSSRESENSFEEAPTTDRSTARTSMIGSVVKGPKKKATPQPPSSNSLNIHAVLPPISSKKKQPSPRNIVSTASIPEQPTNTFEDAFESTSGWKAPISNRQVSTKKAAILGALNKQPPVIVITDNTVGMNGSTGVGTGVGDSTTVTAKAVSTSNIGVNTYNTAEISVNTDVEQRSIGISTRDDVVYIYETVEVSRRKKHRHGAPDNQLAPYPQKTKRRHRSSSSSSTSGSSSGSSSRTPTGGKIPSDTSLKATPRTRSSKKRNRHHHHHHSRNEAQSQPEQKEHSTNGSDKTSSKADDDKEEKIVAFTVRTWSGRIKRMSYSKDELQGSSVESIRNQIMQNVGIPKETMEITGRRNSIRDAGIVDALNKEALAGAVGSVRKTLVVPSQNGPLSRRRFSVQADVGSLEQLRKQRDRLEELRKSVNRQSSNASLGSGGTPKSSEAMRPRVSSWGNTSRPRGDSFKLKASKSVMPPQKPPTPEFPPFKAPEAPAPVVPRVLPPEQRRRVSLIKEEPLEEEVEKPAAPLSNASISPNEEAKSNEPSPQPSPPEAPPEASPTPEPPPPPTEEYEACRYCNRRFAMSRLEPHEAACFKTSWKKSQRPVFDSRKARLAALLAKASAADRSILEQAAEESEANKTPPKPSMWREKHKAFIDQIRYAKKVTAVEKAGGDIRSIGPAPTSFTADLVQCSKCGRKFNTEAIKRHQPNCKAERR